MQPTNTFDRFRKARAALILDQPFFGTLALQLQALPNEAVDTMATDGKRLWYSPQFADSLTMAELRGVICHEVMHCALRHHTRRQHREPDTWNVAGDHVINLLLKDAGMTLPAGGLADPVYSGMSTEAVYAALSQQEPPREQQDDDEGEAQGAGDQGQQDDDGHGGGEGDGQDGQEGAQDDAPGEGGQGGKGEAQGQQGAAQGAPDPDAPPAAACVPDPGRCGVVIDARDDEGEVASAAERAEQDRDWQVAMSQAAQQAEAVGSLPGNMRAMIDGMLEPAVDWRAALREFLTEQSRDDFSWGRPNRRLIGGGLYLPGMYLEDMGEIVLAVDTSASVSDELLKQFAGEINAIMEEVAPTLVHVVYCDTRVTQHDEFQPDDLPFELEAKGRGGTLFQPVFDLVADLDVPPAAIIYFTDMGAFDLTELEDPDVPVMWADYDGRYMQTREVPFGEHVFIDIGRVAAMMLKPITEDLEGAARTRPQLADLRATLARLNIDWTWDYRDWTTTGARMDSWGMTETLRFALGKDDTARIAKPNDSKIYLIYRTWGCPYLLRIKHPRRKRKSFRGLHFQAQVWKTLEQEMIVQEMRERMGVG